MPKPAKTSVLELHVRNHPGVMSHITGLFARRAFNLEAIVCLPVDGGSDTLRAATTWDVADDGRLSLRHGDSFIMWIEWAPGARVSSRSVQPFGAATTRPARKATSRSPATRRPPIDRFTV